MRHTNNIRKQRKSNPKQKDTQKRVTKRGGLFKVNVSGELKNIFGGVYGEKSNQYTIYSNTADLADIQKTANKSFSEDYKGAFISIGRVNIDKVTRIDDVIYSEEA